jgi:endogenous inhibitor of DNA gyrase (YacG/DUF329 family)
VSPSPKCPICSQDVAAREANKGWPFCSERCRLADLGKWLGEEYRIPAAEPGESGEEEPPEGSRH